MAFSRRVSLTNVVMAFLLRAVKSGPVRPFESELIADLVGCLLLLLLLLFHRRSGSG